MKFIPLIVFILIFLICLIIVFSIKKHNQKMSDHKKYKFNPEKASFRFGPAKGSNRYHPHATQSLKGGFFESITITHKKVKKKHNYRLKKNIDGSDKKSYIPKEYYLMRRKKYDNKVNPNFKFDKADYNTVKNAFAEAKGENLRKALKEIKRQRKRSNKKRS